MPETYVTDFTALTQGYYRWNGASSLGTPITVSYSFLNGDDLPTVTELPPFSEGQTTNYLAMDSVRQAATRLALAQFTAVSGVNFIEVQDPEYANIKLLSNEVPGGGFSWAFSPYSQQGDSGSVFVTMTEDDFYRYDSDWETGGWAFNLLLHEVGHAMGLDHPHEGILLDPVLDNHNYTIMSYDWTWDGRVAPDYPDRANLAPLDVDALHFLYGAATFADLGWMSDWNEISNTFTLTGNIYNDVLIGLLADSILNGATGEDSLYGQSGNDILSGQDGQDVLMGANGEDKLYGGNGDDQLFGGNGDDFLIGGEGNDTMNGGDGADRAVYQGTAAVRVDLSKTVAQDTWQGLDVLLNIEHLTTGGGNDRLSGNAVANLMWAGAGNDNIRTNDGNDTLYGEAGNDTLYGENGDDYLFGGADRDVLYGGTGNDWIDGGDGALDSAYFYSGAPITIDLNITSAQDTGEGFDTIRNIERLYVANGNNRLVGNAADNSFFSSGGDDTLYGMDGNDSIYASGGNDTLIGGEGDDYLYGAGGNDVFIGGNGNDRFYGGDGYDRVVFQGAVDTTVDLRIGVSQNTGHGLDRISNVEHITSGNGNDRLIGNDAANAFLGLDGDDTMFGLDGNDALSGGNGNDILIGGNGNDRLDGGADNDRVMYQGSASVRVDLRITTAQNTGHGWDTITNIENVTAASGNDRIVGDNAGNSLLGLDGNDVLFGLGGSDTLMGGNGQDQLNGGNDRDFLIGGADADSFVFNAALGGSNIDAILDFEAGIDRITLDDAAFTGMVSGALAAGAFAANTSGFATLASHRIIYETDTGGLFFDSDGTGAALRVQFATVDPGLALTAADFIVF